MSHHTQSHFLGVELCLPGLKREAHKTQETNETHEVAEAQEIEKGGKKEKAWQTL